MSWKQVYFRFFPPLPTQSGECTGLGFNSWEALDFHWKLNSFNRHSGGANQKAFVVLIMRKCSPILMTNGRHTDVHSTVAAPVCKHHGRLFASVTAESWHWLLFPSEGERKIRRRHCGGPCKTRLENIDPKYATPPDTLSGGRIAATLPAHWVLIGHPNTCASRITMKLFQWHFELPLENVTDRPSACSCPLLLSTYGMSLLPPSRLSALHCASWKDLFIYSADVGTGAVGSPWLLHSHVTHGASLEILPLL